MRTPPLILSVSLLTAGVQLHSYSQDSNAEPELSSRAFDLSLPAECEFEFDFNGPETDAMDRPRGVAVAPNGEVIVIDGPNRRALVFNAAGALQFAFGEEGTEPGQFVNPLGVAVALDGRILVADAGAHLIKEFDASGNFLRSIGAPGDGDADGDGELFEPADVCVDSEGAIVVADSGNSRVQFFDAEGDFLRALGEPGVGNGQLANPQGLAVARDGTVFVADTANSRVQIFNADGDFVRAISSPTDFGLFFPFGVAVSNNGILVVADSLNDRIRVFTSAGDPIRDFGSLGDGAGEMSFPEKVAIGRDGAIYVADSDNGRIQVWSQCLCSNASGDIDCSGSLNILDVVAAESHRNGDALNADRVPLGDVNESGDIDTDDIDAIGSRVLE